MNRLLILVLVAFACGGRQELVVDQGLQRVAERVLGVNRLCEPSLAQLDGAHEGPRSFQGAVGEREVRVLVLSLPKTPSD
jgi:hypothetical protein